jgi:hypothetical protein
LHWPNKAFRDERVRASRDLDEMMKKIAGIPLQSLRHCRLSLPGVAE